MKPEIRIEIRKAHDITPAVIRVGEYCREAGFNEIGRHQVATVASELAHNIIKYADHGSIRLREVYGRMKRGIEIIAIDTGPGIPDVKQAMQDNFSSSGTLGLGLPGIKRMMDDFEIQSTHDKGTRILARKWI